LKQTGSSANKVLLNEFKNRKLAVFAKRCTRMAVCLVDMCPEDPLFSWPTLTEEMERLVSEGRGKDFIDSLSKMEEAEDRDRLVRFASNLPNLLIFGIDPLFR
jgi:hypothetical protein